MMKVMRLFVVLVIVGCACGQAIWARPRPRMDAVPYMRCPTCMAAAETLHAYGTLNNKKMRESDLLDLLESYCDPYMPSGEWITHREVKVDRETKKIVLELKEYNGKCGRDCATVSSACVEAVDDTIYEMAEYYITHKGASKEDLQEEMCKKMGSACRKPSPDVPETWKPDGFVPATEEDLQMDKIRRMSGGNVQVMGSDEMPAMMQQVMDIENRDLGTDERPSVMKKAQDEADDGASEATSGGSAGEGNSEDKEL